jgi:hypothetical protein
MLEKDDPRVQIFKGGSWVLENFTSWPFMRVNLPSTSRTSVCSAPSSVSERRVFGGFTAARGRAQAPKHGSPSGGGAEGLRAQSGCLLDVLRLVDRPELRPHVDVHLHGVGRMQP